MGNLRYKKLWTTSYNDIAIEIAFWGEGVMNEGNGMWNYYISVNEDQLSADDFEKLWLPVDRLMDRSSGRKTPCYGEYDSLLGGLHWNGGITYYRKYADPDTGFRRIKAGCDYGHLWDMEAGYPYNVDRISADARRTADDLRQLLKFKRKCSYSGKQLYEEDGKWHEGKFYSSEGLDEWTKWRAGRG